MRVVYNFRLSEYLGSKKLLIQIDEICTLISLIYNFSTINNQQKPKRRQFYACNILNPNCSRIPSSTLQKSKTKMLWVIFELYLMKSSFYIMLKLLNTWLSQFCVITNPVIYMRLSFYYSLLPNFLVKFKL